uniref:Uncharacterized protein n=1 Tax=Cannabis sativa TaxID=3483 RepID=A0A803R4D2_CANSA
MVKNGLKKSHECAPTCLNLFLRFFFCVCTTCRFWELTCSGRTTRSKGLKMTCRLVLLRSWPWSIDDMLFLSSLSPKIHPAGLQLESARPASGPGRIGHLRPPNLTPFGGFCSFFNFLSISNIHLI